MVFIAAWAIATILAGCLICRPFAFNWDQTIPGGHCGDQVLSFTITGVFNLLSDVLVLCLPLPYLYNLQMRLYKKLVLIGVFSVGLLYVLSLCPPLPVPRGTQTNLPLFFFFFFCLHVSAEHASSAPSGSAPYRPWTSTTSRSPSHQPTSSQVWNQASP